MKFISNKFVKVAAVAVIGAAAAGMAQARDNVFFSVGANVAPGVSVGVSNYGYAPPVYAQPYYAPRYYGQAPVYVEPQPVYYQPYAPVYYETMPGFAPVFVNGGYWWGGNRYYRNGGHWMRWEGAHGHGNGGGHGHR